jgi:hypothetical protein
VFKKRVLSKVFGTKKEKLTGDWRELHNELHNLYPYPNVRIIKSSNMRLTEPTARVGDTRYTYNILVGKPKGMRPEEDQGVDGIMILKWILNEEGIRV